MYVPYSSVFYLIKTISFATNPRYLATGSVFLITGMLSGSIYLSINIFRFFSLLRTMCLGTEKCFVILNYSSSNRKISNLIEC